MPEPKKTRIYYEGDDDRNVLEGLKAATLLPAEWEVAKRPHQEKEKYGGKEGMIKKLAPFIRPVDGVGGSAIVVVDLDDLAIDKVGEWFEKLLAKELPTSTPPVTIHRQASSNIDDLEEGGRFLSRPQLPS